MDRAVTILDELNGQPLEANTRAPDRADQTRTPEAPASLAEAGDREKTEHRYISLSTVPIGPTERRVALAVVLVSILAFGIAAPFAKVPLARIPAFIPSYEAALAINDLITALLLFGLFAPQRSRALLALASGYLFDALMMVPHALSFPGVFSDVGLLGAGPQTTAWLYMF